MRKLLLYFISISLVAACNNKKQGVTSYVNEDNLITVSVPKPDYVNQHFFDPAKYADSVKFVWLKNSDDNLIATISELLFTDDYIIVADRRTASILFFDHNGNYSHKINKRGRGHGEYLSLGRVMLDSENKNIIVYDMEPRAMLYYDFEGKFISKIDDFCDRMLARDIINLPSGDFMCYRQDKLGAAPQGQAGTWITKKDGIFNKFIYTFDFNYKSTFVHDVYNLSVLPNNRISFVDQNQTAVFYIDNDKVYKSVQFKLPGKTEADFPEENSEKTEGRYYSIADSQEKGDYIFTNWKDDQNRGFQTILKKRTGELETGMAFSPIAFDQFIPGGRFVRNNDPYIYSTWFSPSTVKQFLKGNIPEEFKLKAQKIIEEIPSEHMEESNPIIQLLYIKK